MVGQLLIRFSISILFWLFSNNLWHHLFTGWFLSLNHLAILFVIHWCSWNTNCYALFLFWCFHCWSLRRCSSWTKLELLCFKELGTIIWDDRFLFSMKIILWRSHINISLKVCWLNHLIFSIWKNLLGDILFELLNF